MTVISDPCSREFVRLDWAHASIVVVFLLLAPVGSAIAETRICLLPLSLPFEEDDERFAIVEGKVASAFEAAGFEITGSEQGAEVYESVDEAWGAIFDPLTGRTLESKQIRFERKVADAFREDLGCHALVRVSLALVRAQYSTPVATWDGTTRQVISTGRSILTALLGGPESGWIAALSLWIHLMDPEGNDIGFRSAGIEPLVELSISRDLDKLPEDRWLRDEEALDAAIESALGQRAEWLRKRATSRGPIEEDALDWPDA